MWLFVLCELNTGYGPSAPNFSGHHGVWTKISLTGVVFFFEFQTKEPLEFPRKTTSVSPSVQRLNESTDIIEG